MEEWNINHYEIKIPSNSSFDLAEDHLSSWFWQDYIYSLNPPLNCREVTKLPLMFITRNHAFIKQYR